MVIWVFFEIGVGVGLFGVAAVGEIFFVLEVDEVLLFHNFGHCFVDKPSKALVIICIATCVHGCLLLIVGEVAFTAAGFIFEVSFELFLGILLSAILLLPIFKLRLNQHRRLVFFFCTLHMLVVIISLPEVLYVVGRPIMTLLTLN